MTCKLLRNTAVFPSGKFQEKHLQYVFMVAYVVIIQFITCSSSIKINREFQDPDFSFSQIQRQSAIKVIASETVSLPEFSGEFRNSYTRLYQSDPQFVFILQKQIADSIKNMLGASPDPTGSSQDASLLKAAGVDQNSVAVSAMQQLFGSTVANYFFVVTSVDITSKVMSNGPVLMSIPGSGGTFVSGGGVERCVVTIHADLWSVKNRRKILSYSSEGDSEVVHSFYDVAMKTALSNSIASLVKYLVSGSAG